MEVKMFLWLWRHPGTPKAWGGRQGDSVSSGIAPGGNQSNPEARLSHCALSSCDPLVIPWFWCLPGSAMAKAPQSHSSGRDGAAGGESFTFHFLAAVISPGVPWRGFLSCSAAPLPTLDRQCWGLWQAAVSTL